MDKPLIYFDSCIWIGMITGEQRTIQSETSALAGLVPLLDKKKITVVSSTLMKTEVLETDMANQQKKIFEDIIKRKYIVQLKDPNIEIMDLAAEIRNFYKEQRKVNDKNLRAPSTPDAIHLATAIYYECNHFFTLDEKNKKDGCGLLKMKKQMAEQYKLDICKPFVTQLGLSV